MFGIGVSAFKGVGLSHGTAISILRSNSQLKSKYFKTALGLPVEGDRESFSS